MSRKRKDFGGRRTNSGSIAFLVRDRAGDVIQHYRKESQLGQINLSQKLGISQSALSKIEAHLLIPTLTVWLTFCKISGIRPDSILDEPSTEDSADLKKAA